MAGLSDVLTAIQNGVAALNNLGVQVRGSFNNIAGQITANSAAIAALQTPSAFSVVKSSDQSGIVDSTFTQVAWQTEIYDIGNHFASNGWTPPAGKVHMDATLLVTGAFPTGNQIACSVIKNATTLAQNNNGASSAIGGNSVAISVNDIANGTDVYTIQVFADVSSGTASVLSGAGAASFFGGFLVSS